MSVRGCRNLLSPRVTGPDAPVELASDLSTALLVLLERLAPEERAAFLLHDVFDTEYHEISLILGKNEATCRQVVHRARERVRPIARDLRSAKPLARVCSINS